MNVISYPLADFQRTHGQGGDGFALGHHGVHGVERVAQTAGHVTLAGDVVDVLNGRVSLRIRYTDAVGGEGLDGVGSLWFGVGSTQMHETGLWELCVDVVLAGATGVVLGFGTEGGGDVGQEHITAAIRTDALGLSEGQIGIQLLEELAVAHVHRFATGQVDSPTFLSPQGERVAGVLGDGGNVALSAGIGRKGVEIWAKGEGHLWRGHLLLGALHST